LRRYLDSVPIEDALGKWLAALQIEPLEMERATVPDAAGRALAEAVFARVSSPHYHASAMDGIAVDAQATFAAGETRPVVLEPCKDFDWVDTGDPMPSGRNAVIMSEDVTWLDSGAAEIIAPASPWQHVRAIGEDIVATELLFPEGHVVRPADAGALLAAGLWEVPVRRRPVVALIPTGDEIVEPAQRLSGDAPLLKEGDIIESNTYVQSALVTSWGGAPLRTAVVPDDGPALKRALHEALEKADIVAINAGSSAGSEDFTVEVIESAGQVLVHGVAQRPGKPVVLGLVHHGGRRKPVIGVPGYPASAFLTFCAFVEPVLKAMLGLRPGEPEAVEAALTRKIASPAGVTEYLRVKVGRVGDRLVASPISRGAGVITSIVRADGVVLIPRMSEGMAEGSTVKVSLLRPRSEIENTVVVIGSHDPGLDLLGSIMKRRTGAGLASSHAGSLGGLMSLRRKEAHAAGTHLIDESTGEYNTSYLARILPGERVLLVAVANRDQGLIVPKGNPKRVEGLQSLASGKMRLVNRQRGAGTRVLLDLLLRQLGISTEAVPGYEHEEYTHTAVASAVATGLADCGLGVLAAARALGLDFVPVAKELYELAIPERYLDDRRVQAMLESLRSREFAAALASMGGYDTSVTGCERWWPE
jgi:putative molybdopterin biosynthesis protein